MFKKSVDISLQDMV